VRGGSSLGDEVAAGVCEGDGWAEIIYSTLEAPEIRPHGVIAMEGDEGVTIWDLPVVLTKPSDVAITVEWSTRSEFGVGLATAGTDYTEAPGTLVFAQGETSKNIEIEVRGDALVETPLARGEWGYVEFTNAKNASVDTDAFFGLGLFVIEDDD